jgi:hypothetical protein
MLSYEPVNARSGSKCEELRVSKSSPLHPTKRTSTRSVVTSLMGYQPT